MTIEEGKPAPHFILKNQDGDSVSLTDFQGKIVVLYFYPKDNTPGWIKEAVSFRELHGKFAKLGVVVLGVSPDSAESHVKFIKQEKINFPLLADPTKDVMTLYEAYGEKVLYGKKSIGVIRSTVLIDQEGNVVKHWKKVSNAGEHPNKVLEYIEQSLVN